MKTLKEGRKERKEGTEVECNDGTQPTLPVTELQGQAPGTYYEFKTRQTKAHSLRP
jgi:hypothetical protein